MPLTLKQSGFRRLRTSRDTVRPDRAVAVSVFTNRDTAPASHAQVAAMMVRHRDVLPEPSPRRKGRQVLAGAVDAGMPRVLLH